MTCQVCGSKTFVSDSRPREDSAWRRRKCKECGFPFETIEIDKDLYEKGGKDG